MPSSAKRFAKWVGLTVFVVLFCELFLRVYAPVPMLPRYVSSADYGVRMNTPNQQYAHTTPDYQIEIRTNSKGIRSDVEIPYDKPPGSKRVVALGDSFLMGFGAHLDGILLNVMVERLRAAGHDVELVNLAVSGFGTAEELVALKAEGMKYEPDLVLVGWHETDLDDNVRSGLFGLQNGDLVRTADSFLPAVKTREILFRSRIYRFLAGSSHLYNWLRDKAGESVKVPLANVRQAQSAAERAKQGAEDSPNGDAAPEEPPDAPSYAERLTLAILQEMEAVSEAGGAALLVVDLPTRLNRTTFSSAFPSTDETDSLIVYSPLRDFEAREGELLFWERSHWHFTPLGNQIVGEGAAELVLRRNLLNPPR